MGVTTYKIKKGDTLSGISQRTGVSVADIAKANNISNVNMIYAGQMLNIPTHVSGSGTATGSTGKRKATGFTGGAKQEVTAATPPYTKKSDDNPFTDIDLSKYDSGYQKSDDVIAAEKKKADAEKAVSKYGDYGYGNQETLDEVMNKILNREEFSYDLNGDALYQQYKDKYIQQGKMAMQDTMGQAAAMTGGYGNSYAATAGNQAYQASLENLNDIVPELYQMAYDKYNQEGQDLYNQYSMLSDDRSMDYSMWADKRNQLVADRDYYGNEANNAYAMDYGEWSDQRDFDTNQYWNETNFGYGQERDKIADQQWQKSFDEGVRQYDATMLYQKERDLVEDAQWQKTFNYNSSRGSVSDKKWTAEFNKDQSAKDDNGEYKYTVNDRTVAFENGLVLKSEFISSGRGAEYNGKKYPSTADGYNDYVSAKILDALDSGALDENEARSICANLGIKLG